MVNFYFVLFLLLWTIPSYSQVRGTERRIKINNSECFECHIVRPEVLREEEGENYGISPDSLKCLTKLPGKSFRETFSIELPESFVNGNKQIIQSGKAHICVAGGYVKDRTIVIPYGANIQLIGDHRKLFQDDPELRLGNKTLLAVRVKSSSEEPDEELGGIEGAIFGRPNNPEIIPEEATVVAQYNAVSHGQLRFEPAVGPNIQNGVLEIELDLSFGGRDVEETMIPLILATTEEAIGSLELVDRIIFCLPTGSSLNENTSWTAFGYLYEPYTYFQQSRCTRLSVVMHELGHTYGFQHSGAGGDDYADKTDYMGYAVNMVGFPRKAFNGHKHWFSGWFSNRQLVVDPFLQDYTFVRLVAFVDYGKSALRPADVVLIRVDDLFIQYNRAKDYNAETDEANSVTVTRFISDVEATSAVAALSGGEQYRYPNFQGSGRELVIEVCELTITEQPIDYAAVKVYLDKGVWHPSCDELSGYIDDLSTFPTVSPSSDMPTVSSKTPTSSPTVSMSLAPTLGPSLEPSKRSQSPTSKPSPLISPTQPPSSPPFTVVSIQTGEPSILTSIPHGTAVFDPISPHQSSAPSSASIATLLPVTHTPKHRSSSTWKNFDSATIVMIVSVGVFAIALIIILLRSKRFSLVLRSNCQIKEKMQGDLNKEKNTQPAAHERCDFAKKSSVPSLPFCETSETEYADDLSGRSNDEIFICETRLAI